MSELGEAERRSRIVNLVDELTRHEDCCAHPTFRHKFAAASSTWRTVMVAWVVSQGALLVYVLHPVVHLVLRLFGVTCP